MLSGLEDFLRIWNRFSIPQLPALAAHQPPFNPPPSPAPPAPCVSQTMHSKGKHVLLLLQLSCFGGLSLFWLFLIQ